MTSNSNKKNGIIQFRVNKREDMLIRMAAALVSSNANTSEYVRNNALKQAEIDLANKNKYIVNEDEMNELLEALESPAIKHIKLAKLMQEKTILE